MAPAASSVPLDVQHVCSLFCALSVKRAMLSIWDNADKSVPPDSTTKMVPALCVLCNAKAAPLRMSAQNVGLDLSCLQVNVSENVLMAPIITMELVWLVMLNVRLVRVLLLPAHPALMEKYFLKANATMNAQV